MRNLRLVWATALLLGLLPLAPGCSQQKKVNECNALIGVINEGVAKIQQSAAAGRDGGAAVEELRDMAASMDKLADDAAKVELSLPELQKQSKDYQAMAREVATAARELAGAITKVDAEAMNKAQAKMEEAVKREDPLVESINEFCQNP